MPKVLPHLQNPYHASGSDKKDLRAFLSDKEMDVLLSNERRIADKSLKKLRPMNCIRPLWIATRITFERPSSGRDCRLINREIYINIYWINTASNTFRRKPLPSNTSTGLVLHRHNVTPNSFAITSRDSAQSSYREMTLRQTTPVGLQKLKG